MAWEMPVQPLCNESSWVYLGSTSEDEGEEGDCGDGQEDFSCLWLQFRIMPFQVSLTRQQVFPSLQGLGGSARVRPNHFAFANALSKEGSCISWCRVWIMLRHVKRAREETCSDALRATLPLFSTPAPSNKKMLGQTPNIPRGTILLTPPSYSTHLPPLNRCRRFVVVVVVFVIVVVVVVVVVVVHLWRHQGGGRENVRG